VAKFAGSVVYTGGKSVTIIVNTIDKFATSVVDTSGARRRGNISANLQNSK
jgi:hypothetical protein